MIIGLTGNLGSGKSTALKIFSDLGFNILDSDQLVKEIYSTDLTVKSAIIEHFGKEILSSDGSINRSLLAQKVFTHKESLNWLENLVHPKVIQLIKKYTSQMPKKNWVVEIPLLFEKNLEIHFDLTICLSAKVDLQLARLIQKGIDLEDAKARIAYQMPLDQKEIRADYILDNNGNIDSLRTQIYSLIKFINT